MKTTKYIFGILIIVSCEVKVDPQAIAHYDELNMALQWYQDDVVIRGYHNLENAVRNQGNRPEQVQLLEKTQVILSDYTNLNHLMNDCEILDYDEDSPEPILKGLESDLIDTVVVEIDQWLKKMGSNVTLTTPADRSDWLLFRLRFKDEALNLVAANIEAAHRQLTPDHIFYSQGDSAISRLLYTSFTEVEVNGQRVKVDSGRFRSNGQIPTTIRWTIDPPGYLEAKDLQYTIRE